MGNTNQFNKIVGFLNIDNTLSINRFLAHAIGLEETVMYQALISKYAYYQSNDQLSEDGWFYSTSDDLEESTTFKNRVQKRLAINLCNLNLIERDLRGMPRKTFYRIVENSDLILDLIEQGETKSLELKNKNNEENSDKSSNNHSSTKQVKQVLPNRSNKNYQTGKTSITKQVKQELPNEESKHYQAGKTSSTEQVNKTKDNKLKEKTKELNSSLYNPSFIQEDSSISEKTNQLNLNERKERTIKDTAHKIIDYDYLISNYPEHSDLTEAIVGIIVRVLACKEDYISFGGKRYDIKTFRDYVTLLNSDMIIEIFKNFDNLEEKITNPISYLAAVLYNESIQFDFRGAEEYRDCC